MSLVAINREKKKEMLLKAQIVFDLCKKIQGGANIEDLDMSELEDKDKKKVLKCFEKQYRGGFTL